MSNSDRHRLLPSSWHTYFLYLAWHHWLHSARGRIHEAKISRYQRAKIKGGGIKTNLVSGGPTRPHYPEFMLIYPMKSLQHPRTQDSVLSSWRQIIELDLPETDLPSVYEYCLWPTVPTDTRGFLKKKWNIVQATPCLLTIHFYTHILCKSFLQVAECSVFICVCVFACSLDCDAILCHTASMPPAPCRDYWAWLRVGKWVI